MEKPPEDGVTRLAGYDKDTFNMVARMQAGVADFLDTQLAMARVLFEHDQVPQVEVLLRELIALAPGREDVATFLAEVLRSQGRMDAAATVMWELAEASGFVAGIALRAAAFARECDRHVMAARICKGALARGAKTSELLVLAGHVARESGDFEAARLDYLAALDAGVDLARQNVLGALTNTKRYSDPSDPDRERCEAQFHSRVALPQARASAGYALAKILDDIGETSSAVMILREANSMARTLHPWSADDWNRFVNTRQQERVTGSSKSASSDFAPVFIVGVPRSGTTLAATLLARAWGVRDRGEMRALRFIAARLRDGGHLDNAAAVAEAAGFYHKMARQDDAPVRTYLDQDPLNFRWLDIVEAMFPQAKVIHLRCDPRDTALSLWSQEFAHDDMKFSSDFSDIATFMHGQAALMAHWKSTLNIVIREFDYETLVAAPDMVAAELAAFVGTSFANTDNGAGAPVTSASVWQARQPVYSTSVGRWRRYEPFVPEFAWFVPPG